MITAIVQAFRELNLAWRNQFKLEEFNTEKAMEWAPYFLSQGVRPEAVISAIPAACEVPYANAFPPDTAQKYMVFIRKESLKSLPMSDAAFQAAMSHKWDLHPIVYEVYRRIGSWRFERSDEQTLNRLWSTYWSVAVEDWVSGKSFQERKDTRKAIETVAHEPASRDYAKSQLSDLMKSMGAKPNAAQ